MTDSSHPTDAARQCDERLGLALELVGMVVWERDLRTDRVQVAARPSAGAAASIPMVEFEDFTAFLAAVLPADREKVAQASAEAVRRGEEFTVEYRILDAEGATRFQRLHGRVIPDAAGTPCRMIGVTLDVTERHQLDTQLRHAQKLEVVGRLAGGIAHDFNNLLTVIGAATQFARETLPSDAPARQEIVDIEAAAKRAGALTQQLLAYSRQQVLRPERLDLNRVVANVERMLRRVLGEDVALVIALAPDLAPVDADVGQLEQVLMNLALNARDAMPNGGTLTLSTENVTLHARAAAAHEGVAAGAYVALRVRDTGVGIDAPAQALIFEPFFTTKAPGEGTGLGLATVDGIVRQSGGVVYVESAPGAGSTFTVLLPQAARGDVAEQPAPTGTITGGRETVLLVEDEAPVRAAVRRMLERGGYRVLAARDAQDALATAEQHAGAIDLVLTDVVMPGVSAGSLIERLRSARPRLRALLMSGYSAHAVAARGTFAEGAALLAKPFGPETLLRHVRDVLDDASRTSSSGRR
ncbi:ATP-binding region ATPase domain protein [Gemmatirosa kalamazoonensis]|uniref:histidine kinase n=1 Tax=Gemmatirosa kalamazoonensis TaxID=861299 RepID=W0RA07_9BACT|nr:ATP-binding protein [Gemmatirosa kalamazoonensis]AHG87949.1 ATP-binding region ATPase domain protein [Gemmatirosa kalamazoonensis]